MLNWFFRSSKRRKAAEPLYQSVMQLARSPHPYREGWVADTLEGRLQMLSLVGGLTLRRLRDLGAEGRSLADGLTQQIFSGLDHALREEGVGDSSIARRIRKMGEQFYGLAAALDEALSEAEPLPWLQHVLLRNVQTDETKAAALAEWTINLQQRFERIDLAAFQKGQLG